LIVEGRIRHIYLIRHGETEDGGVRRIRGWKNVPLSVEGRRQIERLGFELAGSGLKNLYTSDMERTKDTAKAIAKTTNAKVILSPQLRSWNLGEFTGMQYPAMTPELQKYAIRKPNQRVPGGEAFCEFKERAFSGLRDAIRKYPADMLGLVTHHGVERLFKAWLAKNCSANLDLDFGVMFQEGEAEAHHELIPVDCENLMAREYV
jgi:2,3-bisphosphoglycerate-dependent phosphoglycerate mutase